MKSLTFILMLFATVTSHSQNLDSLKIKGKNSSSNEKSMYYNEIGIRHYRLQEYDSAIKYLRLAAGFANQNDQFELAGQALNNAGAISDRKGDFKGAILNYQMALVSFGKTENDTLIAQAQTNLGIAFKGINIYDKALENLYESAKVLERLDLKRSLSSCYNAIGNIHRELRVMDISFEYLNRALDLRKEIEYKSGIAQSLHNLGIWNFETGALDKSQDLFTQSITIKRQLKNERSLASTLAKIGEVYAQRDSPKKAEGYFQESLVIREKFRDIAGIATSSNHLARLYLKQGALQSAITYLKIAKINSENGSLLQEQATALELFQEYYHQQNEYQKALEISNQLAKVNSKILDDEKAKSLMESEIRFETYLKDEEIASQQIKVDYLENRTKALITIAISLSGLVLISTLLLRTSRKLSNERKTGKERVERLLKELNHRTKNHLQAQSGLIKQQILKLKDQPTQDLIKDIDNQIKAINLIHQSLYVSTEEYPENINLTSYVENIVENLIISFGMARNEISLDLALDEVDIDVHKAMPIGLILNESVTNSFKYAFGGLDEKKIKVVLKNENSEKITLRISDNGKGFDFNKKQSETGGLRIMQELAIELDGRIDFLQHEGFVVELQFSNNN